jgi:hypothetical protein
MIRRSDLRGEPHGRRRLAPALRAAALRIRAGATCRSSAGLLAVLLLLAPPVQKAAAYCRSTVASGTTGVCSAVPNSPFLNWRRSCVTYTFNDKAFTRLQPLTEAATRQIFSASFTTWAVTNCSGRKPFLVEQAPDTTSSGPGFVKDAENVSVISVYPAMEWDELTDHSANAIALTLLWYEKKQGEILDVDMDLNLGAGQFADCEKVACRTGEMVDLQNTITHEAGHLLGLGHTSVSGATMQPQAIGGVTAEISKRSLAQDDIDGYCALNLPSFTCPGTACTCPVPPIYKSTTTRSGCACDSVGQEGRALGWLGPLTLLGLAAAVRYRLRRRV